jgi:hypothetical protein
MLLLQSTHRLQRAVQITQLKATILIPVGVRLDSKLPSCRCEGQQTVYMRQKSAQVC